jgi:putative PIN family toxin of toxin-antitoxin system
VRVLLDTNVLIAAFITHGACHELFEHVARNHRLISSKYILGELNEHLLHKFKFSKRDALEVSRLIREKAELVPPEPILPPPPIDPDDLPILGTAVAGGCDCLVTGDKELQELQVVKDIPIFSPARFWRFEDEQIVDL